MAPQLRALLALAVLSTAVCGPAKVPVSSSKPPKINPGGGAGPSGAPDGGSGGGLPDGSVPDGSTGTAAGCYFCEGSAALDGGCPSNYTETLVTTATAVVCVCEDQYGNTGCELCSDANPANGGCDSGTCTDICAPGGFFSLCVEPSTSVPDQCIAGFDAG